jgi:hypothetical protein
MSEKGPTFISYDEPLPEDTMRAAEELIKKQSPGRYGIPEPRVDDEESIPPTEPTPKTRQREAELRHELYAIEKEDIVAFLAALRAYPKSEGLTPGALKTILLEIYGKKEEIIDGIPVPAEIPAINTSDFMEIPGKDIEDFVVQLKMEIMMSETLTMEAINRISKEM